MTAFEIWVVVLLFIITAALAGIGVGVVLLLGTIKQTLVQTQTTLKQAETLTRTANNLVLEQVTPTVATAKAALDHVEVTTRGISEGMTAVRNVAGTVSSFTNSNVVTALKGAAGAKNGGGAGKWGLVALGAGAAVQAFLRIRNARNHKTTLERQ
jgi:hypothetical protein